MERNLGNWGCQCSAVQSSEVVLSGRNLSDRSAARMVRSFMFMVCLLMVFSVLPATRAWAQPDVVLDNFNVIPDSENSFSTLVADPWGNLYGTAAQGGAFGFGTVFVLCAPGTTQPVPCQVGHGPWAEFVLYSFMGPGANDGANPRSTLIFGGNYAGRDFTLYGTTYNGGNPATCAGVGCGTVFELCAPALVGGCGNAGWVEHVLHQFAGVRDGAHPFGGVIADKANYLYGTTVYGGGFGKCLVGAVNEYCGTVFKMKHNAAWVFAEAPIHRFKGAAVDGAEPTAALCCNTNGGIAVLYGTTFIGGKNNAGTVFQVANAPGYAEAVLYNFCSAVGCTDGANPYAPVIFDAAGNMYGTTFNGGIAGGCGGQGCGTIFNLGVLPAPIWNFLGTTDGAHPTAGLTLNAGVLYGTTLEGGVPAGLGTIYQFPLPFGPDLVRWSFVGAPGDGANPFGGVIFDPPVPGGFLYGTTLDAGGLGFGVAYLE